MDYGYSNPGQYLICTIRESGKIHSYEIPEMWLVGATSNGVGYPEAVRCWHEQALLQGRYETERGMKS